MNITYIVCIISHNGMNALLKTLYYIFMGWERWLLWINSSLTQLDVELKRLACCSPAADADLIELEVVRWKNHFFPFFLLASSQHQSTELISQISL